MKWSLCFLSLLAFNCFAYELYLVRHFEKDYQQTNPYLTKQGRERAQSLALMMADKGLEKIYSTNYHRTMQTAIPTAKQSGLAIDTYAPNDLKAFAKTLLANKQTSLVVGHSNTTPELLALLGGEAKKLTENDYGELFILIVLPNAKITQSVIVGNRN